MSDSTFVRQCDACLAHDALDRLGAVGQPTLVICGQEDGLTPPKLAKELAGALPDAHLVSIPHAGHLVMAEAAKRFDEIVLQFLEEERPS
jgi:pimeloyl-ACP methyl ester carboxylesterase